MSIVKKVVRASVRGARRWLTESEAAPQDDTNYGSPPYSYKAANHLFLKLIKEHGLRRPHFVWGAFHGVNLAKMLGLKRVSLLEFGAAGGNGLTALEKIADTFQPIFGLEIEVHGFDAVEGMPKARDHRDLPNLWREGFYPMDPKKLRQRLQPATRLHLGLVEDTVSGFINSTAAQSVSSHSTSASTAPRSRRSRFSKPMNACCCREFIAFLEMCSV